MTSRERYRYTERLLYDYAANMARKEVLKSDLAVLRLRGDVQVQNYMPNYRSTGEVSDPVSAHTERCLKLEREIARLERLTEPITLLLGELSSASGSETSKNAVMLKIYDKVYRGRIRFNEAADEIGINIRTAYNWRHELVRLAGEYLGL